MPVIEGCYAAGMIVAVVLLSLGWNESTQDREAWPDHRQPLFRAVYGTVRRGSECLCSTEAACVPSCSRGQTQRLETRRICAGRSELPSVSRYHLVSMTGNHLEIQDASMTPTFVSSCCMQSTAWHVLLPLVDETCTIARSMTHWLGSQTCRRPWILSKKGKGKHKRKAAMGLLRSICNLGSA